MHIKDNKTYYSFHVIFFYLSGSDLLCSLFINNGCDGQRSKESVPWPIMEQWGWHSFCQHINFSIFLSINQYGMPQLETDRYPKTYTMRQWRTDMRLLPVLFLSMVISLASSLLQTTSGSGEPEATHSRVTLLPSVCTMSELLRLSTILGGTEITRMRK